MRKLVWRIRGSGQRPKAPLLTAGTNARHVIKAIETSSPAYPPVHCGNMVEQRKVQEWNHQPFPAQIAYLQYCEQIHCCTSKLLCLTVLCFEIVTKLTAFFSPWLGLSEPNDIPKGTILFGQPKDQLEETDPHKITVAAVFSTEFSYFLWLLQLVFFFQFP